MIFDVPHVIAVGLVVLGVIWLLDHVRPFNGMKKGAQDAVQDDRLFVAVLILGLVWPYGATA